MSDDAEERRSRYEAEVVGLAAMAAGLLAEGLSEEMVARRVVAIRNRLKAKTRDADPPELVRLMEERNLARYGDPLGPTADQLHRRYRSWKAVIAAAARPARLSQAGRPPKSND